MWPLNVGQVYTTLQRPERDGLVAAEEGDDGPQRSYRLTDAGAVELEEWLHTPPDASSPPRDELVIKVLVALRLVDVDVRHLVQVHRWQLVELMQQYTRLKEDASDEEIGLSLVVDSEIFRLDSLIRWLDTVEGRLTRLPAPLPPAPARAKSTPQRLRRRVGARR